MTAVKKNSNMFSTSTSSSKSKKSKRFTKRGKKEFKPVGKRGRLILRNLPFKCNEEELHRHFSPYGDIKDINLLRRPDKRLVGCGFIEFTSRLDADKAKEQLNGKPFLGRQIYIDRAFSQNSFKESKGEEEHEVSSEAESESGKGSNQDNKVTKENLSESEDSDADLPAIKKEKLSSDEEDESNNKILQTTKQSSKSNVRKSRLIIRNLSFKATESKLKDHLSKFGEVTEVKLLRKPDNSLVGCGFVEFSKKTSAAKAIHHASGKPFLGRPIIIDWAIAKDRFKKMQETSIKKKSDIKVEPLDEEDVLIKKEKLDSSGESDSDKEEESSEEEEEESEDGDEEESGEDEDFEDSKRKIKQEHETPKIHESADVDEGKTVFVKSLPFSATDEDFRECMEQFGPVYYALVCRDKLTEHSKGSGFVKFKNKEDAEKCLSAGTELTLNGTILDPHPALRRSEAQLLHDKTKEKKDNRNLYLMKEGMIIAGTPAAKSVSVTDMERRLQLEQWKTTKLRNLNMFVSRNRLVIHNLPPTFSDKQLKKLFLKHTNSNALIKEARIMRDLKHVNEAGKANSKGYGFITFEKHEDALKALRSINNNPDIFTPTARPIVSFSIENRTVLNAKTKRMIRSRQKNPLCKDYKPEEPEVPAKRAKHTKDSGSDLQNEPEFAGMTAKPGATMKMRKNHKLKIQAQQHLQDVRKEKRDMKMSRQVRRAEHMKIKQVEKKMTKKNKKSAQSDDAFNSLVDKYKSKMLSQASERKKWYAD